MGEQEVGASPAGTALLVPIQQRGAAAPPQPLQAQPRSSRRPLQPPVLFKTRSSRVEILINVVVLFTVFPARAELAPRKGSSPGARCRQSNGVRAASPCGLRRVQLRGVRGGGRS